MLGVSVHYMVNSVLRFDHKDFLKAMKVSASPKTLEKQRNF